MCTTAAHSSPEDVAHIRLQEGEIAEYGFFDLDGARRRLADHTFHRLVRALAVRDGCEQLQDLEEGRPRRIRPRPIG